MNPLKQKPSGLFSALDGSDPVFVPNQLVINDTVYSVCGFDVVPPREATLESGSARDADSRKAWRIYAAEMHSGDHVVITIRAALFVGVNPEDVIPTKVFPETKFDGGDLWLSGCGRVHLNRTYHRRPLEVSVRPAMVDETERFISDKKASGDTKRIKYFEDNYAHIWVDNKPMVSIKKSQLIRAILRELWAAYQKPKREDHFVHWEKLIQRHNPCRERTEPDQILRRYRYKEWLEIRPHKSAGHLVAFLE